MGLTQKEKDWLLKLRSHMTKNEDCRLDIVTARSGIRSIQIIFPYGKQIKDTLDTGRNNFNNKQRRIFERLINSLYLILFMERVLPGISSLAKQLALERLQQDKIINEVNSIGT